MSIENSNNDARFEVAKTILARYMALAIQDGFDPEDEITQQLLEDEKKLNQYDEQTIDKIINEYAPYLKINQEN